MALGTNELLNSVDRGPFPRVHPTYKASKKLAAIGGGLTLEVLTPMAFDTVTKTWKVWAVAGINGGNVIRAFVYPEPIDALDANEKLGVLMIRGELHAGDVPLPAGQNQPDLDAALATDLAQRGLNVQGLPDVY